LQPMSLLIHALMDYVLTRCRARCWNSKSCPCKSNQNGEVVEMHIVLISFRDQLIQLC
jgi:hypothetical protein